MRLADFILDNREPILAEWEAFARTCAPASNTMDVVALRDHADQMLSAIVADMRTPQNDHQQAEKSRGRERRSDPHVITAAEHHGAGRAASGFTLEQMVAEYRALRASVIRLWTTEKRQLVATDLDDLTRFNEAIDQALAESVTEYNDGLVQSKEIFLGILGHDLRTPLAAISTSASFMLEVGELPEPHRMLTERIGNSASRTLEMVGELLDFTRGRLGGGIPIVRGETELAPVVREVVAEIVAANPGSRVEVETEVEPRGEWDGARLSQALSNLIGNAVQHGAPAGTIQVAIRDAGDEVAVVIHNHGEPIPAADLDGIFNPLKDRDSKRGSGERGPASSLGLGLYIAERIVDAHGGRIAVTSGAESGTTFTVHLPRTDRAEGRSGPVAEAVETAEL